MGLRKLTAALALLVATSAVAAIVSPQALAGPADTAAMVKDIDEAGNGDPSEMVSMGGVVYFAARIGMDYRLWRSDGTADGTYPVTPTYAVAVTDVTKVGDKIFYRAADAFSGNNHGLELGVTDGNPANTKLIDVRPGLESSSPADITNVGGVAYFQAYDATNGSELWKSNGTELGTTLVKNINVPGNASPDHITDVGGEAYFSADDGTHGYELWKSNGTDAGTTMVGDLNTDTGVNGGSSYPELITDVGGTAFFAAQTPSTGWELFSTDGSTIHTMDINPGTAPSNPQKIVALNGSAITIADDGTHGIEPFKSDGQTATLIKDVNPTGGDDSLPQFTTSEMAAVGDEVFFNADDGTDGLELWRTNGTAAGTQLVKDIHPSGDSSPTSLTAVDGYLYMSADDGTNGTEPWVSDGTAAGTRMVANVNPTGNGSPGYFAPGPAGSVFFSAADSSHGNELFLGTDTVAPTTVITSGPAEGSSVEADEAVFGFGGDEHPLTFECKLDAGSFAPCTSPKTLDAPTLGAHTFQVRATDAAGNPGTTVTRNFTVVDTTPPELTVDGDTKQKSTKQVVVEASCNEICDLAATGSISIPKVKGKKAKGKKTYALGGASRDGAGANSTTALTLKIKGRKAQKALKKSFRKKPSTATVTVDAADQAGNDAAAQKFKVKVGK